jgi:hypothetical protein
MSILSAPPPPPGQAPEPPSVPGAIPRLSLSTAHDKAHPPPPPPGKGLNIKVAAESLMKVGGKPPVVPGKPPVKPVKAGKPGKLGAVLRKRAALGPVAKAGIGVVIVAAVIAGVFFYRIFFPEPGKIVTIKAPTFAKPLATAESKDAAAAMAAKAAALEQSKLAAAALAAKAAEAAKAEAAAAQEVPTPTPATESVMAQSPLTTDVKVNSTHLDAAPAASPAFRAFVAGASIGGVFQGKPSRALINGTIVREGQIVENTLGIAFERIDSETKTIYFKDSTGAEVSKGY